MVSLRHHLENLHDLGRLFQRHGIRRRARVKHTELGQLFKLVPSNPYLRQRPRHAQFAHEYIQQVPEIRAADAFHQTTMYASS